MLSVRFFLPISNKANLIHRSVISALANRYTPWVTLPYYIALTSQFLAALYALLAIRETLPHDPSSEVLSDTATETGSVPLVMRAVGKVAVPVRPLAVIMPYRDEKGVWRWELLALSISLFATTCGVSPSIHFKLSVKSA